MEGEEEDSIDGLVFGNGVAWYIQTEIQITSYTVSSTNKNPIKKFTQMNNETRKTLKKRDIIRQTTKKTKKNSSYSSYSYSFSAILKCIQCFAVCWTRKKEKRRKLWIKRKRICRLVFFISFFCYNIHSFYILFIFGKVRFCMSLFCLLNLGRSWFSVSQCTIHNIMCNIFLISFFFGVLFISINVLVGVTM